GGDRDLGRALKDAFPETPRTQRGVLRARRPAFQGGDRLAAVRAFEHHSGHGSVSRCHPWQNWQDRRSTSVYVGIFPGRGPTPTAHLKTPSKNVFSSVCFRGFMLPPSPGLYRPFAKARGSLSTPRFVNCRCNGETAR